MRNIWQDIPISSLIKTILSLILTVSLVVLLLTQISLRDVLALLTDQNYGWVTVAGLFYFITNIGRAWRLKILLPNQVTQIRTLLPIAMAHAMFNNLLPARTGEFSLLYFLRRYQRVSLGEGGVALIMARIMDYLAVAIIFILAALLSLENLSQAPQTAAIIWTIFGMMVLATVMLILLAWWGQSSLFWLERMLHGLGLTSWRAVAFGLKMVQRVIEAFQAIHSFRRHLYLWLCSLFIWGTVFVWFYAFLRAMGIETTLLLTAIGATFAILSKALPLNSVGGFGTHEAGWTVGFMLVGFDKTVAISSGFVVNILVLLVSIVFGLASLWILSKQTADNALETPPVEAGSEDIGVEGLDVGARGSR